jgi:hypothetical protein
MLLCFVLSPKKIGFLDWILDGKSHNPKIQNPIFFGFLNSDELTFFKENVFEKLKKINSTEL